MELYNKDCFEAFKDIKDKTIDLFVLDLPYGQTACKWDSIIDLKEMWVQIKRIMKKEAVIVFFTTTKFGYKLIQSNEKWFRYDLVWKKSRKVGFLSANKMPLRQHEMMYVFKEKGGTYNPQKTEGKPYIEKRNSVIEGNHIYSKKEGVSYRPRIIPRVNKGDRHPTSIVEAEPSHEMMYVFKEKGGTYNPQKTEGHKPRVRSHNKNADCNIVYGDNFKITPADTTEERHPTSIIESEPSHEMMYVFKEKGGTYNPQKTEGKPYKAFETKNGKEIGEVYGGKSLHNENKGDRHPTSIVDLEDTILEFKNPCKTVHKTQKPVDLCEWLIKTYSNEGDTVMDFCMGSGTTGVACKNTNRRFIGVEKDPEIFKLAEKRINE
jgi:DNA modification methylase